MIDGHTFLIHFPVKLYFGVIYYDVMVRRIIPFAIRPPQIAS